MELTQLTPRWFPLAGQPSQYLSPGQEWGESPVGRGLPAPRSVAEQGLLLMGAAFPSRAFWFSFCFVRLSGLPTLPAEVEPH